MRSQNDGVWDGCSHAPRSIPCSTNKHVGKHLGDPRPNKAQHLDPHTPRPNPKPKPWLQPISDSLAARGLDCALLHSLSLSEHSQCWRKHELNQLQNVFWLIIAGLRLATREIMFGASCGKLDAGSQPKCAGRPTPQTQKTRSSLLLES